MKHLIFLIVFALFVVPAFAQEAQQQPPQRPLKPVMVNVFWENDSTPLNRIEPSDRHYTNGTAVNVTWALAHDDPMAWMPLDDWFGKSDHAMGIALAQVMFTPENLSTKAIVTGDEPYAGYLYAGLYLQRTDPNRTVLDHLQLDLGVVGDSSLAEPIQKSIHEWVGATHPDGWRHQIDDEPTIQLSAMRKWKINLTDSDNNFGVQLIPYAGASLGTVKREADFGSTLRLGWNMPDDFGPARISDLANGEALTRSQTDGLSFYVFGRSGVRFVQHDLMLDGSDFQREEHTVRSRPIVGEFQFGAAVGYNYHSLSAELAYAVTFTTDTFYHQRYADKFAAVSLKIAYWF